MTNIKHALPSWTANSTRAEPEPATKPLLTKCVLSESTCDWHAVLRHQYLCLLWNLPPSTADRRCFQAVIEYINYYYMQIRKINTQDRNGASCLKSDSYQTIAQLLLSPFKQIISHSYQPTGSLDFLRRTHQKQWSRAYHSWFLPEIKNRDSFMCLCDVKVFVVWISTDSNNGRWFLLDWHTYKKEFSNKLQCPNKAVNVRPWDECKPTLKGCLKDTEPSDRKLERMTLNVPPSLRLPTLF